MKQTLAPKVHPINPHSPRLLAAEARAAKGVPAPKAKSKTEKKPASKKQPKTTKKTIADNKKTRTRRMTPIISPLQERSTQKLRRSGWLRFLIAMNVSYIHTASHGPFQTHSLWNQGRRPIVMNAPTVIWRHGSDLRLNMSNHSHLKIIGKMVVPLGWYP